MMNRYRRWRQRRTRWAGILALGLGLLVAEVAHAGPRDDMQSAYDTAKGQFNELELEAAQATLEAAITRAQGAGLSADPSLAPLLVLRGGIIYSNTGDRAQAVAAFQEAVRSDYYVALPIELRSDDLQRLLDEARATVSQPATGPIAHTPPAATKGEDIPIEALSSVPIEEGVTMVLYWRKAGTEDAYDALYLETFGNLGTVTIPAAKHGDADLEYFFYVYNPGQQALANLGDKDKPLALSLGAGAGGEGEGEGEGEGDKEPRKPRGPSAFPRVFINLGVGTGFGIARGTAELTYQQFTPGTFGTPYGAAEQACAIERWTQGDLPLAATPQEFQQHLLVVNPAVLPGGDIDTLVANYNPTSCAQRHPVTTGFASAPFHITPEVMVRVWDKTLASGRRIALLVGAYGRLQVVTGSKVITVNPNAPRETSFNQEVFSPMPPGTQIKPPFTWAAGVKLKTLIGRKDAKFQGMVGAFGGYGNARLRVNMKFSNDRNGNSVPDLGETALSGPADANNQVPVDQCTPVWPYNNGCMPNEQGTFEQDIARSVQANAPANEFRIDTVRLGPAFAGVLFGFNYQIHKNFALFGEVDVGGWFPNIGSLLIDVNVGPSITF